MLERSEIPALRPVKVDDYVPPVNRWMMWSGVVLVGGFGVAIALASLVRYNVTVKAPATLRPAGDMRLVQSELDGTVERIEVQVNQVVQQGDVIAQLDRSRLDMQHSQLQGSIRQTQLQLAQMNAQIQFLDAQIAAETRSRDQAISVAQAQLRRDQREYADRQATTQADLVEAEAALALAQTERQRYEQLVTSGAVSQLQVEEKQAAVRSAEAQVARAHAALNPTDATVAIAQEQIGQQAATGAATLANLNRERESLIQLRVQLQNQLLREQSELQKNERDREKAAIRATSDGVILQLNLRNTDQVIRAGDTVAEIVPNSETLVVKAQVNLQDINQVKVGQLAQMRVSACPYPDYGVLAGQVTAVSPDAIAPQATSTNATTAYEVTIQPRESVLSRQGRVCELQSGMQADAYIVSREESALLFFLRRARLWVKL